MFYEHLNLGIAYNIENRKTINKKGIPRRGENTEIYNFILEFRSWCFPLVIYVQ